MTEPLFDIVFRGDIVLGHNIQEVKQRLGQLFKADSAKVDALFTGGAVSLKRNVDAAAAEKYKAILTKSGAQVQIRPAGSTASAKSKRPVKPTPASAPALPTAAPTAQKAPQTLKDRIEAQERARKVQAPAVPTAPAEDAQTGGLSLAPVGSYLLKDREKKPQIPVNVDTSDISIKPMSGDLLEESEKPATPVATVKDADFDLADTGSDLLKEEERKKVEPIDVGDLVFDIAEVGSDMIDPKDKAPVAVADIDMPELDIAPTGSDMNQKKKSPPPPPPDTSAISLAD